ncbi:MAG: Crp/Fnr family transcriptional regulator, partial [Pseudomonadota bacterium]
FTQLSPEGRATVARALARHRFAKGAGVVEKGQPVSGAYFVLDGRLRVYTLTPSGKEATLYLLRPGETCVLALNSLFNDMLYPAWVEAEEDTTVGVLPGPAYRALFERERPIQDLTVHTLSTVVLRLMAELEEVHSHRLDQRLASFLLNSCAADGVVRRTQQQIAAHIGTTREVVARLMADFAARGWVETGRGQVRVARPAPLAEIVRRGGG